MANISDNVSKAYQDGGDPIKAGADNLHSQYLQILKASNTTEANKWMQQELKSPAIQKYLPEFAAVWGEEKFSADKHCVDKTDLENISSSSQNDYDKTMASTLLQTVQNKADGLDATLFVDDRDRGYGITPGAFDSFLKQNGVTDNPNDNPELNQVIDLKVDPTVMATAIFNAAAELKRQSAGQEGAAAVAAQVAKSSIPQGEAVPAAQVSETLAFQQAQQTNIAASADDAQATRIAIRSGKQEIKGEDASIAKNGIATGNGLDINPGPNAIAGGKINKTDLGDTATPDTAGGTTNDTTKVGDNCSESVTSQYKAQAGDTLWSIAAKMMKVPNDKAHAPAIYRMAQLLETMNPGLRPHHIRLGETINFASLDDQE